MRIDRRAFLATLSSGAATLAGRRGWPDRAVAQEPLRAGVVTSLTGSLTVYGTAIHRMYQVVAEEINKAGGIQGRSIQLVTEDEQSSPDAGVRGARKPIDVNKVHVVPGTTSSAVTLAVVPLAVQANLPLFTVSSSPAITTAKDNDLMFRTSTSQEFWSGVFALAAGLLILNNPYGLGLADAFTGRFTKAGGRVTGRVVYNASQPSCRSEIQQALGPRPDVILFGGYTPDGIRIFKERFQLGLGGRAAEGIIVVEAAPNVGSSAYRNAGKLYRPAAGVDVEIFAASAYDHLMIGAPSVLAAPGDSSGDAIRAQIRKVANPPGKVVGTWAAAAPLVRAGEVKAM